MSAPTESKPVRATAFLLMIVLPFVVLSILFFGPNHPTAAQETPQNTTLDLQPGWWSFNGAVVGYQHTGSFSVYNSGPAAAQNVAVHFYAGTPENGARLGATQVIIEIPVAGWKLCVYAHDDRQR
jgi:hypothetical protein